VREEATLIVNMIGALAARLPPQMPLSDEEKAGIQPPLEMVLYKYNGSLPCEWQLAIALGMIALPRYLIVKQGQKVAA
jgi:hypothetical protein